MHVDAESEELQTALKEFEASVVEQGLALLHRLPPTFKAQVTTLARRRRSDYRPDSPNAEPGLRAGMDARDHADVETSRPIVRMGQGVPRSSLTQTCVGGTGLQNPAGARYFVNQAQADASQVA